MKQEFSAGVVVVCTSAPQPMYLLVQSAKTPHHWGFAKGHLDAGETDEIAALRELKEEADITVHLEEGFRSVIKYKSRSDTNKQVTFFLGFAQTMTGKAADDVQHVAWLSFDQAHARITHDQTKQVLVQAKHFVDIRTIK